MRYPDLEPVGTVAVPDLPYRASPNQSSRNGRRPRLIFLHRWGGGSFAGVVGWLSKGGDEGSGASSHVVYAGERGPDKGKAVQLVPWSRKAWTECELNPVGISVESADGIWLGTDPDGFARLARITALLCKLELDACRAVNAAGIVAGSHGFARHRDAGALGCSHPFCPTADAELWQQFCNRTVAEFRHGGFRSKWGKA